ncbi:hypothetical protein ACFW2X_32210 [Streptomyces antibioticus]|uniref:hypothetical protein n=1 Tax=Streptomyces antibioticus TaxID=1890 RepID=UPI0036C452C9
MTALLLTLPGGAVTPLLTAQSAAAATATGGTVCMRSATDSVLRWSGATSWTPAGESGAADRIHGGGAGLLRAAPDGSGVYRYQGAGQEWERIGTAGPGAERVVTDDAIHGRTPDGVHRWNTDTSWTRNGGRGTAEQIVSCEAVATTDPVEAGNGGGASCHLSAPFSLSAGLSEVRRRPDLTEVEKILVTQYLVQHWDTVFSLETSVCNAIERARSELVAPVR